MKAIILAAGRGSRMEKLTDKKPKCLVEFQGQTLLDRQLEALRGAGIKEIGIVTGYKRDLLCDPNLTEFHNPDWQTTNMVSSLNCARDWLSVGPVIISYSDIFYDSAAVELLIYSDAELAITYDPDWLSQWSMRFDDPLDDAETFRVKGQNQLVEIGNKPKTIGEIEGQYMGLLRLSPRAWQEFETVQSQLSVHEKDKLDMTSMLQKIVTRADVNVQALAYTGAWGEIDSLSDLLAFEKRDL